jgi:hypothetical protein
MLMCPGERAGVRYSWKNIGDRSVLSSIYVHIGEVSVSFPGPS